MRPAPNAFAVSPALDGGYAGGNTAEGTNALFSLTSSGLFNTALGANALYTDTSGGRNTAMGVNALRFNLTGNSNTAIGVNALHRNISVDNTAVGDSALFSNTTGALTQPSVFRRSITTATATATRLWVIARSQTTSAASTTRPLVSARSFTTPSGDYNTAVGYSALNLSIPERFSIALGYFAGTNVTTASNVICIGANVGG